MKHQIEINEKELTGLLHASPEEIRFRPDDLLSVQVYGIKDFAIGQRIAQDGTLVLPFIGKVHVAGATSQEVQGLIAARLKDAGIIRNPQVTLTNVVQPWAIVTVSGDVLKPGSFPAFGNLTVMDYLSQAGGLNQNVSGYPTINAPASNLVTLIRPSLDHPVSIPLGPDPDRSAYARIPLFPGDEIRVGRVGVVYAVGAFKNQGAFALKSMSPTTVMQLIAQAGGIGFEADTKDAHIIRNENGYRTVLDFNVDKVLRGRAADLDLQSDDILFVPPKAWKAAIKGGGTGIIVSLAAAYLYTHP